MKNSVLVLGCVAALGCTIPAAAANARTAAPRNDWTVFSHAESCSLQRQFGDEDDDLNLRIETFGSATNFQFTFTGRLVPFKRPAGTEIRLAFSPDGVERDKFPVVHGRFGSRATVTFPGGFFPPWSTVDPALVAPGRKTPEQKAEIERIGLEFAKQVTDMSIEFPLQEPLKILTGSMDQPLTRLRACLDKLTVKWGLDLAARRAQTRDAAPLPATLDSARQALSGMSVPRGITAIPVRVRVDEAGRATECVLQVDLGARVSEFLCAGLKGGYTPALDAQGQPVASIYHTTMQIYAQ